MGFDRRDGGLAVGDRGPRIVEGAEAAAERPLLNHIEYVEHKPGFALV